ncbi:MAG: hypothetical protein ACJARD_000382 [Alphaproteobacteria bacterium]|jgi:hypothetical protein
MTISNYRDSRPYKAFEKMVKRRNSIRTNFRLQDIQSGSTVFLKESVDLGERARKSHNNFCEYAGFEGYNKHHSNYQDLLPMANPRVHPFTHYINDAPSNKNSQDLALRMIKYQLDLQDTQKSLAELKDARCNFFKPALVDDTNLSLKEKQEVDKLGVHLDILKDAKKEGKLKNWIKRQEFIGEHTLSLLEKLGCLRESEEGIVIHDLYCETGGFMHAVKKSDIKIDEMKGIDVDKMITTIGETFHDQLSSDDFCQVDLGNTPHYSDTQKIKKANLIHISAPPISNDQHVIHGRATMLKDNTKEDGVIFLGFPALKSDRTDAYIKGLKSHFPDAKILDIKADTQAQQDGLCGDGLLAETYGRVLVIKKNPASQSA